jgi:phospholipid/cholesterol/gamma-HCH transport system permease protein
MFPLLAIITDFVGVVGGYMVGVKLLGINPGVYIGRTIDFVQIDDIFAGLYKATVFGLITALVASFNGYHAYGGAEGVGRAATSSVVMASVMILVSDYLMSAFMV